jgi:hypothetical protein
VAIEFFAAASVIPNRRKTPRFAFKVRWLNVDYREGKYVIRTEEQNLSAVDAVRLRLGSEALASLVFAPLACEQASSLVWQEAR